MKCNDDDADDDNNDGFMTGTHKKNEAMIRTWVMDFI
jgi:hypothetical protein